MASAASFTAGALPAPLLAAFLSPKWITPAIVAVTIVLLFVLGSAAAQLGGASRLRGSLRVAFWGLLAMGCTILIGRWFGTVTG
jgi:VIT1/CCC1 family predicted Fe2+/Mn2+ transporter